MKKKASIFDLPFYSIFIFMMAIVIIIAWIVISVYNTGLQASDLPSESKSLFSGFKDRFQKNFNWFMVTIVIVMIVGMILTAFVLKSNPAIAMIAVLIWIIVIGFTIHLSNAFNSFATDTNISGYVAEFSLMSPIMNNLPRLVALLGALFIIILYAKDKQGAAI